MGLASKTVMIAPAGGRVLLFEDKKLMRTPPYFTSNYSAVGQCAALSPDNKYLFYCDNYTYYFFDVSGNSWIDLTQNLNFTGASYTRASFSADGSRLLVAKSGYVYLIDAATQSVLYTNTSISSLYGATINSDGTKIAFSTATAPFVRVVSITAGSYAGSVTVTELPTPMTTMTSGTGSASYIGGMGFSSDSSELFISKTSYGASIHEVATGNEVWNVTSVTELGLPNSSYTVKRYSDVNSNGVVALGCRYATVLFFDIATRTSSYINGSNLSNNSQMYFDTLQWSGDDTIWCASLAYAPGLQSFDYPTLSQNDDDFYDLEEVTVFVASYPGTAYKVTGNIVESLEVSTWRCAAYDLETFNLITYVDVTGSTFEITLQDSKPVMVLVSPIPAVRWEESKNYVIGTEVFPTNTVTTPFYYRCVGAGLSSATEPSWGTVAGGQTNDGTVVWEMIEGLVQPVAHMPLSPVPV